MPKEERIQERLLRLGALAIAGSILTVLFWVSGLRAAEHTPPPLLKRTKVQSDSKILAGAWGGISAGVGLSLPISPQWFRTNARSGVNYSAGIAYRPRIRSNHSMAALFNVILDYSKYPADPEAIVRSLEISPAGTQCTGGESRLLFGSLQVELSPVWVDKPFLPYFLFSLGIGEYKSNDMHVYGPGFELHQLGGVTSVGAVGIGAGVRRDFGLAASLHLEVRLLFFGFQTWEPEPTLNPEPPMPRVFEASALEFRLRTTVPLFY